MSDPKRPDGATLRLIGAAIMAGCVLLWFLGATLPQPTSGTQDREWLDAIRQFPAFLFPYGFATWALGQIVGALFHLRGRDD